MARRFLMAWDLDGKKILVVGGGPVGEGKVEALHDSGGRIVVVDPELTPRLADLAAQGRIRWIRRRFRPYDVWSSALVVAATGDPKTNGRIRRWAHLFGIMVNAVDDPPRCDVIIPAVVRRGPATIAISTNGMSPGGARFMRHLIGDAIPPDIGDLLEHAAIARARLRDTAAYRYDYQAWHQRLFEPGLGLIRAGRTAELGELRETFIAEFADPTPRRSGRVTLVGAGPGGADLITVRGAAALATADLVVYDRLADPSLLDLASVVAERVPVGKRKGSGASQNDINALMRERAARGDHVVRLKGGDPYVFGRGAEEVDALAEAGIPVEVVPGLSSALAGPLLAGISLTERGKAASFTVISGHRDGEADQDWEAVASGPDTLVILMAASNADVIAERLIAGGRKENEPAAVIHRVGFEDQRHVVTNLEGLATEGCPFPSPCVIVIGEVAARSASTTDAAARPSHGDRPGRLPM